MTAALVHSAYRTLLRQATYFDRFPLAKAMLSACPGLRSDSGWVAFVNRDVPADNDEKGLRARLTLSGTDVLDMKSQVRAVFRDPSSVFDARRFFDVTRRLEKAKDLHEGCSRQLLPTLKKLPHPLRSVESLPVGESLAGTLLLAHPVLVDDFTQACVLVTHSKKGKAFGLTLNSEGGSVEFLLEPHRLEHIAPAKLLPLIQKSNVSFFAKMPLYLGGPLNGLPVLIHSSAALAESIANLPLKSAPFKSAAQLPFHGEFDAGWYCHSLLHVLCADPAIVKRKLNKKQCRVIMNYCEWNLPQLNAEVAMNWWLPVERMSARKSLGALLAPTPEDAPTNFMWQRAVHSIGGTVGDYARLDNLNDRSEESDYRRTVVRVFAEDATRMSGEQRLP